MPTHTDLIDTAAAIVYRQHGPAPGGSRGRTPGDLTALARQLHVHRNTLNSWRDRNRVPYPYWLHIERATGGIITEKAFKKAARNGAN